MEYREHEQDCEFGTLSLTAVDELLDSLAVMLKKYDPRETNNAATHLEYLCLAIATLLNNVTPEHVGNDERERRLARVQRWLNSCALAYFIKRFDSSADRQQIVFGTGITEEELPIMEIRALAMIGAGSLKKKQRRSAGDQEIVGAGGPD